tara:strand:- start:541 stop:2799 length:2259 start_codon:yes stop_codon:yes gene_type:complete
MSYLSGFQSGLKGAGDYSANRDRRALDREILDLDAKKFDELKRATGVAEQQKKQELDRQDTQQKNFNREQDNADAEEKREQFKFNQTNTQQKADTLITLAMDPANKWWSPAKGLATFDQARYQSSLESENTISSDRMALHVANSQAKDENFVFDKVRRVGGKIYIEGTYVSGPNEGQKGVANESGDANPDSPVLEYTPETLARDVASEWPEITGRSGRLGGSKGMEFIALNGAGQDRLQAETDARNAALQADVVDAAEAMGAPELVRGFKRALSEAGDDKQARQEILLDMAQTLGIDTSGTEFSDAPTSIIGNAAPEEIIGAKGAMGGYTPKSASSKVKQYNSNIARLENKIAKGGSDEQLEKYYTEIEQSIAARTELINDTNQKSLSDSQTRVADLTAKAEKATEGRKEFWNKQLAKEQTKLDELIKGGIITPAMKTEAWADLKGRVLDDIETMDSEEVDAMVDSGKIKFTPEDVAAMKQRAEELKIRTIEDIAKLPTSEQIGFRALMGVISKDATERQYMRKTMDNLTETGNMSISAQDAVTNNLNTEQAITARLNANASIARNIATARTSNNTKLSKAGNDASEFHEKYTNLLYDQKEGGSGKLIQKVKPARQVARLIPGYLLKINSYGAGTREYDLAMSSVSAAISDIIGVYAEDGGSTWGQEFMSFFRPDPTGDNTDFDLRRVTVDNPENPTMFFYRGSSTDGAGNNNAGMEGAGFKISTFANDVSASISKVVLKQAIANTKARLDK